MTELDVDRERALVEQVARRVHREHWPHFATGCRICPDFARAAVTAVLSELAAEGRLLPEGCERKSWFAVYWLAKDPGGTQSLGAGQGLDGPGLVGHGKDIN